MEVRSLSHVLLRTFSLLLASDLVALCRKGGFHGIDIDAEHLIGKYYKGYCPSGEVTQDTDPEKNSDYLASLSKSIKSLDSSLVVSHAPQYPYFGPSYYDVYTLVNTKAGDAIDFYNLQYYNNGDTSTYDLVFVANPFEAAVQQLLIPVQKIVVGKSMDLSVLTSWVTQAASDSSLMDWRNKRGVMVWELFTTQSQMGTDIQKVLDFFQSV